MPPGSAKAGAAAGRPSARTNGVNHRRRPGDSRWDTAEPPGAPISSDVIHQVPGRVRLRVPDLKNDPTLGDRVVGFLRQQPGVSDARVNLACAALVVSYDPSRVGLEQILAWLGRAATASSSSITRVIPRPSATPVVCGAAALGLGLLGAPAILSAGILAVAAVPIVARAVGSLVRERQVTVDVLDTMAITILGVRGDLVTSAMIAFLVAGGEYIRSLTARRSRIALSALVAADGRLAWVVRGQRKERIPATALSVGDTVVVYPGELVLADGVVTRGRALVDQKILTGESTPVLKTTGAMVYSSTVLTDGKLYIRAEHVGNATRAARIVRLLDNAPNYDTRATNHAGRFADRLVLPTLLLAGGIYAVTGNPMRAAAILTFDFATGIRVSAPTTVLASLTAAAKRDILVKGGRALEQLARIDTLVFDKTGTLTGGNPIVVDVRSSVDGLDADAVLALAAAAENRLSHPAALAIVRAALARHLTIPERGDSHYTVGLGIEADVEGRTVHVGSPRFFSQRGIGVAGSALAAAERAGRRGATTVFVARDGRLVGQISYADIPRPEAASVLQRLRERGIANVIMVTGDQAAVARSIARQIGIEQFEADVFPERKAEIVRELRARGHVVGVIGDGINDSPALAHADVSVSLKAGTDVAQETADVVLHGDLHGLPEAIDIARESAALIRQNLGIIAVPNAAGMVLATTGTLGPIVSTVVNNGSTIVAALNGLRPLLRVATEG